MTLLFQPEPFYQTKFEAALPSLPATKEHFLVFLDQYMALAQSLEADYAATTANLEIFLGAPGQYVKVENYQQRHTHFQVLKDYYKLLLNACRRRYDFWLNDIIPEKYQSKPTGKRKRQRKTSAATKP